jgi:hypothetical protein
MVALLFFYNSGWAFSLIIAIKSRLVMVPPTDPILIRPRRLSTASGKDLEVALGAV